MSPSRSIRRSGTVLTKFGGEGLDARTVRVGYLVANVFELMIATVSIVAEVVYLVDRRSFEQTSLGKATSPFDLYWTILYLIGASLIVVGLVRPSPRLEVMGLIGFACATIGNVIAISVIAGVPGTGAAATYIGLVIACALRIRAILWALRR